MLSTAPRDHGEHTVTTLACCRHRILLPPRPAPLPPVEASCLRGACVDPPAPGHQLFPRLSACAGHRTLGNTAQEGPAAPSLSVSPPPRSCDRWNPYRAGGRPRLFIEQKAGEPPSHSHGDRSHRNFTSRLLGRRATAFQDYSGWHLRALPTRRVLLAPH